MRITITIDTDNAAFEGDATPEVLRILRELSAALDQDTGIEPGVVLKLRDVNGNTVGKCEIGEASTNKRVSADELADTIASLLRDAPNPPKSIKHRYAFTWNLARATLNRYRVGA